MTRKRTTLLLTTAVVVAALVATYAVVRGNRADGEPYEPPSATAADLTTVSEARVFFAHQSVGVNILDGLPAVYREHGLPAPRFAEVTGAGESDNLRHLRIGENGDPLGKVGEFDRLVRAGLGEEIDVAVLKLCYSDIREDTDVAGVFAGYRDTLAALERDYPEVTFVAATVPLNVIRGPRGVLNAWLGRPDRFGPEHNVAREQFNALVRSEYAATGHLFDVAAVESTTPGGDRIAAYHDGKLLYALDKAYASDSGHLNADGAAAVADAFLAVVADAVRG